MVTVKVEPGFADCNNFVNRFNHTGQLIDDLIVYCFGIVRMNAHTGIDVGVAQGQVNAGARTLKVAADRQNVFNAILSGAVEDFV
jgi:hypothetical protein